MIQRTQLRPRQAFVRIQTRRADSGKESRFDVAGRIMRDQTSHE